MKYSEEDKSKFLDGVSKGGPNGCWVWTKSQKHSGYGGICIGNKSLYAHRVSYEIFVGEIPAGYTIDHLCRNRGCVNPKHLEAVTPAENKARGESFAAKKARQTHCIRGHPFSGDNLVILPNGQRRCRICHAAAERNRKPASK